MARVRIGLSEAAAPETTGPSGRFLFHDVAPGPHNLLVSAVGYRTVRHAFTAPAGTETDIEIFIAPEGAAVESVEVRADPFELTTGNNPGGFALDSSAIQNLGGVLASDPLRSAQTAPGVVSGDDFNAGFSVRAAPFSRIGIYLDGVLLHAPQHRVDVEGSAGGSTTAFDSQEIQSMRLETGAFDARFEDRTAGVLELEGRAGSRERTAFAAGANASSASLLAEGPLGRRGSWLAVARKSYLEYLLGTVAEEQPALLFGFADAQARVIYDVTRRNRFSLSALGGNASLDRSRWRDTLGLNSAMLAGNNFSLAALTWTWTKSDRLVVANRAAWMRERSDTGNPAGGDLGRRDYREWVAGSTASALLGAAPLEFGFSIRRIRAGEWSNFWTAPAIPVRDSDARGAFVRSGAFVQQKFAAASGRILFSAGGRWDTATAGGVGTVFSPQAAISFLPFGAGTRFSLRSGQYVQWPAVEALFSERRLLPERAIHYVASLEQRLGDRARLRIEAWNRQDRDLVARGLYEPRRLPSGAVFANDWHDRYRNSMRGYARGFEMLLQRRTSSRVAGWISYSLTWARSRDGTDPAAPLWFPSDFDRRHAANLYLAYRITPSVAVALRTSYATGQPVPGFYRVSGASGLTTGGTGNYSLDRARNALRLPAYERTDIRLDKQWTWRRARLTLYAEVENVLNRRNLRFDSFDGFDPSTGRAWLSIDRMLPVLPACGIRAEF